MLKITPLETDALIGVYDEVKRLFVLLFRGNLTSALWHEAQSWLNDAHTHFDSWDQAHGVVCDLRQVMQFSDSIRLDVESLPVAFVVSNSYQERLIGIGQSDERRRVLRTLEEAFQFARQYNRLKRSDLIVLPVSMLDSDHMSCHYQYESGIIYVQYYGALTGDVTGQVYAWLTRMFECCGLQRVIGAVFDYRAVTLFAAANLGAMQRSSAALNDAYNMRHIALPVIVGNSYQEQMARLAMRINKDEPQKRIVPTMSAALQFVSTYHDGYSKAQS